MATIIDVAEKAGVSIKTVSRVMNNQPRVTAKTKARVEDAMAALNYRPSQAAQQMRSGKSRAIGLLYGAPASGYQSSLNAAMMRASERADRYLAVSVFDEKREDWKAQISAFLDRTRVTSLVLLPPLSDVVALQEFLLERDISFVLVSPAQRLDGTLSIAMDDHEAAAEMTRYLIDLGHTRIAHIAGDLNHISARLRRSGYEDAMKEAGLVPYPMPGPQTAGFDVKQALSLAQHLVSDPSPPSAIFAANDELAMAVFMAASKHGFSVPDDLSIAGFDDTFVAQMVHPALTTIAQPFDDMAEEAVALLADPSAFKASEQSQILIPFKKVIRGSTGRPP